jgi:tetratricopeptide (TPR) repeat protein
MATHAKQLKTRIELHPLAPAQLLLATRFLSLLALLFAQQIVVVQAQVGGGSIAKIRRPANPPVYREPRSEPGGGRLKDETTTKRAIDNPEVTAGSQPKAKTGTVGGGTTPSRDATRPATGTAAASKILGTKSGGGSRGAMPQPVPAPSVRPESAAEPATNFESVEDAIEAGNSARDQKPADYRAAELAYKAATQLAPDDERGFIGLGNIFYDQRDFKQAISAYRKAVELKPKNFSVWENLGTAYYEVGQYKEAIEASSESVRLNPKPPGPFFTLTWASLTIGDGETAGNMAKAFTYRWQPFFEGDSPYYVTIAGYLGYREAGQTEEANKLLAVPPDSPECGDQNWVCRLLKYLRHEVSAAQLLKEANDNGRMTEAQTYVGVDLALSGKRAEALPYLRWVVANGDRTFTEYALAKAWLKKLESQ